MGPRASTSDDDIFCGGPRIEGGDVNHRGEMPGVQSWEMVCCVVILQESKENELLLMGRVYFFSREVFSLFLNSYSCRGERFPATDRLFSFS